MDSVVPDLFEPTVVLNYIQYLKELAMAYDYDPICATPPRKRRRIESDNE